MLHRTLATLIGPFLILNCLSAAQPRRAIAVEPQAGKQQAGPNPALRTDAYGDPLPPVALARMGTLRDFIGEGSSRIIFSPDGRFVTVSSGYLGPRPRLWDPVRGRSVREFKELDRLGFGSRQVAFSQDGKRIAVADYVMVWVGDIDTGRRIRLFPGSDRVDGVAFSPDGEVLLVRDSRALRFWDIAAGTQTRWPSLAGMMPVAFTHYFDVMGVGRSPGPTALRFGVSRHEIRRAQIRGRRISFGFPIAMSPDRTVVAFHDPRRNTIPLWDLAQGRYMRSLPYMRYPPGITIMHLMEQQIAFSPDGKLLAAGDTLNSLSLWNVATGHLYRRFHNLEIDLGFAFAPDGKHVVTGGRHFRYWDIARGREIQRYPERPPVVAIAFTPDGKSLATAAGPVLRLWDPVTGREIHRFRGPHRFRRMLYPTDGVGQEDRSPGAGRQPAIEAMAIAPDGKTLASGAEDGSLWLWDLGTGREIREIQGMKESIGSIAFAPDGKTFAAGGKGGISLVDTNSGHEVHHFPGPAEDVITGLSFSPDGTVLASEDGDGLILWDLRTHHVRSKLAHPDGTWCVVFAPDGGTLATGDVDGVVRVWDLKTGAIVQTLARDVKRDREPPRIYSLAFTRDGKTLVSAGEDHFVTLWDPTTGRELRRLTGHAGPVRSLAISPDGKTLASGSDDGTALIWDLTAAELKSVAP